MDNTFNNSDYFNLGEETSQLLLNLKLGFSPGISYDTAWVASLDTVFPKSFDWIIRSQKIDGSWGGSIEYFHDRIISTLASIVVFSKKHRKYELNSLVEKGEEYISKNLNNIKKEKHETIGFELLFPTLIEEAERLDLNLPSVHDDHFKKIREEKISKVLLDFVYSGKTTLSFSAEFLGRDFDVTKAENIKNPNGSVGNSPSATAYFLRHESDEAALSYLKEVYALNKDGSIMTVYPFEIFEKAWVIYHFLLLGIPMEVQFLKFVPDLTQSWTETGVGISKSSFVCDSDDTAVAFRALHLLGVELSPKVFEKYEQDDHFQCFEFERDPSISTNIHILDAIKHVPNYSSRDSSVEKIVKFLKSNFEYGSFWKDKWHLSPYYVTSHAIIALLGLDDSIVDKAIDWILRTQKPDGSWGYQQGTMEETAYSMLALLYYHENSEKIDDAVLSSGIRYLANNYYKNEYPEMWIAKGLYCPINVVRSSILAVLYKSMLQRQVRPETGIPPALEQVEPVLELKP